MSRAEQSGAAHVGRNTKHEFFTFEQFVRTQTKRTAVLTGVRTTTARAQIRLCARPCRRAGHNQVLHRRNEVKH